jgi:hypothetical protein
MAMVKFLWLFCLLFASQQESSPDQSGTHAPPPLPVINYNACPFEGCMFRKWVVTHDSDTFSTWQENRKLLSRVKKGDVVIGLTGVHITYEPDHIQVLTPLPELGLQHGDIILRYMYHGEGYADIWMKGKWKSGRRNSTVVSSLKKMLLAV